MKKTTCLLPLALGTFGLGITEYVMMGILPDIAKTMKVSIPLAGNFISSYALGVVFGSILLVLLGRTKPLKNILIVLVSIFTLANFSLAFINHYSLFCLVRFIAGLPHGAMAKKILQLLKWFQEWQLQIFAEYHLEHSLATHFLGE